MKKKAKKWIVSAGVCLLALTGMNVSFGQGPIAPIPEMTNDGIPALEAPGPIDIAPAAPMPAPAAPAPIAPTQVTAPAPVVAPTQVTAPAPAMPADVPAPSVNEVAQPAPAPAALPQITPVQAMPAQQPCQQCNDPYQRCPSGSYYSTTPYYGQDFRPWWASFRIRPVPYTPVENERFIGGRVVRDRYGKRVPVEPPFYTTRSPRDFYLDKPRPLGY